MYDRYLYGIYIYMHHSLTKVEKLMMDVCILDRILLHYC